MVMVCGFLALLNGKCFLKKQENNPAYNKLGITLVFICHLFVAMKMLNFIKSQQNHMFYKNTLNAPHSVRLYEFL